MELSKIKTAFNFIKKNKRPVLKKILVQDGLLKMTDLETTLEVVNEFGLEDGLHDINTLGLDAPSKELIEDFPLMPIPTVFDDNINITQETISRFLLYVSKDETKPFLRGIAVNDNHLVATDGHRLLKEKLLNTVKNDVIIPSTSLKVLTNLLKKYKIKNNINMQFGDGFAVVKTDNFKWCARLIAMDYPKWQAVIPSETKYNFVIDNWIDFKEIKPLLNTNKTSKITFKNGEVLFEVVNDSLIETKQIKIGRCDDVLQNEIGINASYLNDIMKKQAFVEFGFNKKTSPISFRNNEINGVIMPMKL